ncbi:membrane protein [Pseudomonas taeanensis MS-3]|uniref:Membrane protein n=2 Tax=Pseudomonas taeanensis TaxID=574962 RepID=A0A0A1YF82_9PSED|nr:membrane protein [Pseudomonas taeanensis MS-3]
MDTLMPSALVSNPMLRGILLTLVSVACFASHDAVAKYLAGLYPILLLTWFRYLSHTLLMGAVLLPKHGLSILRSQRPWLQLTRALALLGVSLLFVTGLRYVPLAEATAVIFLAPLLVTLLSATLLRERINLAQWLAVVLGFIGVLVIVRPAGAMFTPAILWPLGAALCFALYQILTRISAAHDSAATSNFLAGAINCLIVSLLIPFFWQTPQWQHLLGLLSLGVIGMCGHQLLILAFRQASPAILAPFSYGQLLFAGLFGWLVFDQVPDARALLGMALIMLAGLGIAYTQGRGR